MVQIIFDPGKFPRAQMKNILEWMKSYRLFHQRCKSDEIELVKLPVPVDFAYASPVALTLRNRLTNIVSLVSTDMDSLLESWGINFNLFYDQLLAVVLLSRSSHL
jgi:hypothetical protein